MKPLWIIVISSLVLSSCERSDKKEINDAQDRIALKSVGQKHKESRRAELEIFHKAGGAALSEPLSLLGLLVTPEKNLILVLDGDAKARMKEVTSDDSARNSLLTVKVNGIIIDDQRNKNGWTSGVVISGVVSDDVLKALREDGVKIAQIKSVLFMYEDFVKALKND